VEDPASSLGSLKALARNWSVIQIWVAPEDSRDPTRDKSSNSHWMQTLENYSVIYTDPKSGEYTFVQEGDSIIKLFLILYNIFNLREICDPPTA
jgi:hypothetical protein